MTGRISEIDHKGLKILYTNLSGLSLADAEKVLLETTETLPNYKPKSALSLINVEGMRFSTELVKVFNQVGKKNLPFVKATAVYGLTSITRLMAKGISKATGRNADFFESLEDAKDWLYQQG